MCGRRLQRSVEGGERSSDPVNRSRMRDAFLAAARQAHAELRAPNASHFERIGAELEPEERTVLERAAFSYVQLFGARRAEYVDHGLDEPTVSRRLGLRLGGWVDLTVVGEDGTRELRQFDLWNGRAPNADPLELDPVKAAVLRLAQWASDTPLRVIWADLVWGTVFERVVDVSAELDELRGWLDGRVAIVRDRIAVAEARSGPDCAGCTFVAACPEHPSGAHFSARPRRPAPRDRLGDTDFPRRVAPVHARVAEPIRLADSGERPRPGHLSRPADARHPAVGARAGRLPRRRPCHRRARGAWSRRRPAFRRGNRPAHPPLPSRCAVLRSRGDPRALPPNAAATLHGHSSVRRDLAARRRPRSARLQDRSSLE